MTKASDNEFPSVLFDEQASAPTTPASGFWRAYFKSDGLYVVDDAGSEVGPMAASLGAATYAGAKAYSATTQTISGNTVTGVALELEEFDTDAYHDLVTNNSRFTIPAGKAGKYDLQGGLQIGSTPPGSTEVFFRKNGTTIIRGTSPAAGVQGWANVSAIADLAEADYVEMCVYQNSGGNRTIGHASALDNQSWAAVSLRGG